MAALSVSGRQGAPGVEFRRLIAPWPTGSVRFIREAWSFPDRPTQGRSKRSLSDPRPAQAPRMETEWPRMTADSLKDCSKKFLAQLANDQGIVGWHAMRNAQLIRPSSVPQPTCKTTTGTVPAA